MRIIKKYANRKLYDTLEKQYISMDRLSEIIKAGEEVTIIDNKTGNDITSTIVSQLIARDKKKNINEVPSKVLVELLRKGRGTLLDYAKKYSSLWQNALTMAEDEVDKFINLLIKDKEISVADAKRLKNEVMGYTTNFKGLIIESIDQRVTEAINMMNLASKEQVNSLAGDVKKLTTKMNALEKKIDKLSKPNTGTGVENPRTVAH